VAAAQSVEVEVLDSRRLGGSWTLDRLWESLGVGAAIRRVATRRWLDGEAVERVIFALVAQRALEPGSKPAATWWVADQVADLAETVDDDGITRPVEQAKRAFGHSKDLPAVLPQVVIAMALTRDGTPIRCWTLPGSENDTAIITQGQGRPWRAGTCAGWSVSPTAGSPPRPTVRT